jgi:hypothetical protein
VKKLNYDIQSSALFSSFVPFTLQLFYDCLLAKKYALFARQSGMFDLKKIKNTFKKGYVDRQKGNKYYSCLFLTTYLQI